MGLHCPDGANSSIDENKEFLLTVKLSFTIRYSQISFASFRPWTNSTLRRASLCQPSLNLEYGRLAHAWLRHRSGTELLTGKGSASQSGWARQRRGRRQARAAIGRLQANQAVRNPWLLLVVQGNAPGWISASSVTPW